MRLLIFSITYRPYIGGAEIAVEEILKRLSSIKATVITARLDKNNPKYEDINGVKIVRVGRGSWLDKYLFLFLAYKKAKSLHKKDNFHISWAIMANYAGLAALFFKLKFPKTPYLLTLQSGDSSVFIWIRTWWFYPFYKMVYTRADYIQAISSYLIDRAKRYGYKKRCVLVPNGVDYELFSKPVAEDEKRDLRSKLGIKESEKVVITTSRLVYKNAVDQLILGFNEWQSKTKVPAKLLIVGDGKLKTKLKKLSHEIGAKDLIIFTGHKDYKELPYYLRIADIFVRPSRSEGMGNSFIEAMAAGVPVVGTEVGGIPDFLEHKITGLFCGKDNPHSIARAIDELFTNQELYDKLVFNGKELSKKYDWAKISDKMSDIYQKLSLD